MFGYVRPPDLPRPEQERFRQIYCGLCHTLGRRYGPAARWILNYDFTFLAILLSEGEGDAEFRRCIPHPLRRRLSLNPSPVLELAADESVILAWWQFRDGLEDERGPARLPYRTGTTLLRSAYERASEERPEFDRAVQRQIARLRELEQERCSSLDSPADTFAVLLQSAAPETEHPVRRRVLEQILYHLGRWVYLVDAADDLKRDVVSGGYNPVALRFGLTDGVWTDAARAEFAATLDHSVHRITTAFELWDFGPWRPILEATFYSGLFQVGNSVLNGTFHRRGRRTGQERGKLGIPDE